MKSITIAGRLTRDAENRTAGSDNVTGFSVAVDDRQGKEKSTSGDFGTRENNGKTYLTVRVSDVTFQGGKPASDGGASQEPARTGTRTAAYDLSDDVPW